jgi:2-deoxy-D-gluconate 3-dehydrogenase
MVTGGSHGVGRMIAKGFLSAGAKVYIAARKANACEAAAAELSRGGGTCVPLTCDLTTADGAKKLAESQVSRYSQLRRRSGIPCAASAHSS